MNERIKQLVEQATELKQNTVIDPVTYTMVPSQTYRRELNAEKFAELIVRECCLQVADVRIENDFEPVGDAVLVQALAGIKKYFGVEE